MFNAEQFCRDFNIATNTKDKRHSRQGWVQIVCPFCTGNPGWHGGFNVKDGYYNCWRCGWHWIDNVVSTLLKISLYQAKEITLKYISGANRKGVEVQRKYANQVDLPGSNLRQVHFRYLESRAYNPEEIIRLWGIKATGHRGDYKFRIIIPIYLDGQLISFTSRDVTGKAPLKYKACEQENEVYHHKYSLYGIDQAKDKCIIVEGPLDVWRFGPGAIGTFGIGFTLKQVKLITEKFNQSFILFDPGEQQAEAKAKELYSLLTKHMPCEIILGEPGDPDPSDMTNQQARDLMRDLGV